MVGRRLEVDGGVAHARRHEEPEIGEAIEQTPPEAGPFAHGDDDLRAAEQFRERAFIGHVIRQRDELDVDGGPVG